ncbi:SDR family oxidoreductase [Gammaproteobacteria bacterium]|nr:SDR family oxidoreductase [Gammaproteobacteria bacterium]
MNKKVIIFGASGSIGRSLIDWFSSRDFFVYAVSRKNNLENKKNNVEWINLDFSKDNNFSEIIGIKSIDSIVWAQGENYSDSIHTFDRKKFESLIYSNVTYILETLSVLLENKKLKSEVRICIISSIWQNLAKQDKLSYTVSKSAIKGLVSSLVIDMGFNGAMINAVLPGVLDTPMTKSNLSKEQIDNIKKITPLKSLPSLLDVVNMVGFLCSDQNTGVTGQFIKVDKGFSNARII